MISMVMGDTLSQIWEAYAIIRRILDTLSVYMFEDAKYLWERKRIPNFLATSASIELKRKHCTFLFRTFLDFCLLIPDATGSHKKEKDMSSVAHTVSCVRVDGMEVVKTKQLIWGGSGLREVRILGEHHQY